jgi:hypothetical protein
LSSPGIDLNRLDVRRLHHVGNETHRRAGHLEPSRVEGYGHQRASPKKDQMPRWDEPGIRAALDQDPPLPGGERVCHHEGVVP